MTENEIIETAKRLKKVGGYVMDGKLAKFQMTPVEARNGMAVYLLVWRNRDDELLFFNELGRDYWDEDLLQELINQMRKALEATDEQILETRLKESSLYIRRIFTEQNSHNN